jgi:hypothetical protein
VNDIDGGLSGSSQALWFPAAAGLALVISISTGFLGMKLAGKSTGRVADESDLEPGPGVDGLDALRDGDFQGALGRSVVEMRHSFTRDVQSIWQATPAWSIPRFIARMVWR